MKLLSLQTTLRSVLDCLLISFRCTLSWPIRMVPHIHTPLHCVLHCIMHDRKNQIGDSRARFYSIHHYKLPPSTVCSKCIVATPRKVPGLHRRQLTHIPPPPKIYSIAALTFPPVASKARTFCWAFVKPISCSCYNELSVSA